MIIKLTCRSIVDGCIGGGCTPIIELLVFHTSGPESLSFEGVAVRFGGGFWLR